VKETFSLSKLENETKSQFLFLSSLKSMSQIRRNCEVSKIDNDESIIRKKKGKTFLRSWNLKLSELRGKFLCFQSVTWFQITNIRTDSKI